MGDDHFCWQVNATGTMRMITSPRRKRRKVATDISVPTEIAVSDACRPKDEQVKEPPIATVSASAVNAPTLPSAVWGRVLEYIIYGEARQVILVNRPIENIVPSYVEAIHIRKPGNLDVVAARGSWR